MIRAEAQIRIARPAEVVFKFVATDFFENYPRWSPEVLSLRATSNGPVGLGVTGRQVRMDQGRRTEATFRVSLFELDRRIDFKGISTPFLISYRLEKSMGQTQLNLLFELSRLSLFMRPAKKLIGAAIQASTERVVRNIKELIESEEINTTLLEALKY